MKCITTNKPLGVLWANGRVSNPVIKLSGLHEEISPHISLFPFRKYGRKEKNKRINLSCCHHKATPGLLTCSGGFWSGNVLEGEWAITYILHFRWNVFYAGSRGSLSISSFDFLKGFALSRTAGWHTWVTLSLLKMVPVGSSAQTNFFVSSTLVLFFFTDTFNFISPERH